MFFSFFFFFFPNNYCKICAPHTPPPLFPIFPSLHLACTEVSSPDFFKLLSLCTPLVSIPILLRRAWRYNTCHRNVISGRLSRLLSLDPFEVPRPVCIIIQNPLHRYPPSP